MNTNHNSLQSSVTDYSANEEPKCKGAAAAFLFDLDSGEINLEVANLLTPEEVYDRVWEKQSLTIEFKGQSYILQPYYTTLSEADALAMLEDLCVRFETAL